MISPDKIAALIFELEKVSKEETTDEYCERNPDFEISHRDYDGWIKNSSKIYFARELLEKLK